MADRDQQRHDASGDGGIVRPGLRRRRSLDRYHLGVFAHDPAGRPWRRRDAFAVRAGYHLRALDALHLHAVNWRRRADGSWPGAELLVMTTLPTQIGGAISVVDSDELATLSLDGLTVGTQVWNADVGSYFMLTQVDRTSIDVETTDGYDDPTWTFANATFTGFEGCTLVVVLTAPNVAFSRTYVIDTVGSATEVDVLDPPAGATTGEVFGSAVLYNDALVTDSVVDANGVTGLRWVIVSTSGTVESVTAETANAIDNSDAANPVVQLSLIHISEPTRLLSISYAVFCLKK